MKPTCLALKSLSILALTGTLASTISAEAASFRLDITRDGKTLEMVVYDLWSGEYPGPVVAIGKSDKGTTKIIGSTSMRKMENDATCTVSNGLYHPWAEKTKTPYELYTVTGNAEYTATKDIEVTFFDNNAVGEYKKMTVASGEKLTEAVYLGEGFCQYVVGGARTEIQTDCAQVGDNNDFVKTDLPSHPTEQVIKLSCKEGIDAYVTVDQLLKQKDVKEGQIESYGSVTR
jgi:hypothetical protein